MKIKPNKKAGGHRTGTLNNITAEKISEILGFKPNVDDDPDKVVNSWGFTVGRRDYGIWDYKGSHYYNSFSTYGHDDVFKQLFGDNYSSDRY